MRRKGNENWRNGPNSNRKARGKEKARNTRILPEELFMRRRQGKNRNERKKEQGRFGTKCFYLFG